MLRHTCYFALPILAFGAIRQWRVSEDLPWLVPLLTFLVLGYFYSRALAFWTDLVPSIPAWASMVAGSVWLVIVFLADEAASSPGEFRGPLDFFAVFFTPWLLGFVVARIANRVHQRYCDLQRTRPKR